MDSKKRIIANTAVQYTKSIVNICLSLYSTRLILEALDVNDYGIYSLVGGVVSIFGYLANSLVVTTQRYISYYHGAGQKGSVKQFFANSVFIHLLICLAIGIILISIGQYVIGHFLNIAPDRVTAAMFVYYVTTLMLITTIATTPFKALLIAHENIVYISVVEVCDGILKLALAFVLFCIGMDKLIFYSLMMMLVVTLNFLAFSLYCFYKYEESHFSVNLKIIDKDCIKQITGFAGWTSLGMFAGLAQTQGTAIILNKAFGTIMNAAFGIASQVNGAVRFVSTSILNAMNPQIMKAEGSGNRKEMLELAGKESKFSTALMLIVSMPLIFEMPSVLSFWLKTVPDNTAMFCRALMIAFIVDQLTLGLHAANQATGKIKVYTIATTLPKVLLLPILWGVIHLGYSVEIAMSFYIGIELAVAVFRIPYMKYSVNLDAGHYIRSVILPLLPLTAASVCVCYTMRTLGNYPLNFIVTGVVSVVTSSVSAWFFTLNKEERTFTKKLLNRRKTR